MSLSPDTGLAGKTAAGTLAGTLFSHHGHPAGIPEALVSIPPKSLLWSVNAGDGRSHQELVANPRYCGGQVGLLSVLHTWNQRQLHHHHVHCLVTGGGLSEDGEWLSARPGVWRRSAPCPD